jgi:hypothetical protein
MLRPSANDSTLPHAQSVRQCVRQKPLVQWWTWQVLMSQQQKPIVLQRRSVQSLLD